MHIRLRLKKKRTRFTDMSDMEGWSRQVWAALRIVRALQAREQFPLHLSPSQHIKEYSMPFSPFTFLWEDSVRPLQLAVYEGPLIASSVLSAFLVTWLSIAAA